MKKIYTIVLVLTLFVTASLFAQAPEKMSYQAVIRNASNVLVTNQSVGMRLSVVQGTANGTTVYAETQSVTSNVNGLVTLEIGNGTPTTGTFSTINWTNGPFFIKTETDPAGGTSYSITGTSQLLSVPYALHSKNGLPTGGTANQVLAKVNATDYNTAWVTPDSGGGAKLDLEVNKLAATQVPLSANGTNTGDIIVLDNVITAPTLGAYSTTTNAYTVGAGQQGLYYIEVRAVAADNTTPSQTVGIWFKLEITPSGGSASFINNRDVYGEYPIVSNANFPVGLKGRGNLTTMVYLKAGDSFVIKGLAANSSTTTTIKNDGSCKLKVVKMN